MTKILETIYHEDFDGELIKLKVCIEEYRKGGIAISLIDTETGEPCLTASTWVNGLQEGEVAIKNYSENQGILDNLILHGIVYKPHRSVQNGFVNIPICKLKI